MIINKALQFISKYSLLIIFILLLPVFFINVNNFCDWGDDFAQYLLQAKYFIKGNNYSSSPVLNFHEFCPLQRGAGFSLVLAPVYALFGNTVQPYLILLSAFLVATGLVLLKFFRAQIKGNYSKMLAALMVLAFVYNHQVLILKAEILPLFVFTLLLYACLRLIQLKSNRAFWWMLVLSGFLISVKIIGISFYLALVVYFALKWVKMFRKEYVIRYLFVLLLPVCVYFLVKLFVFGNFSMQGVSWYHKAFAFAEVVKNTKTNLLHYGHAFGLLFEKEIWGWANVLLKISASLTFLVGLVYSFANKKDLTNIFFVIYLIVLLTYQYLNAGVRFLLPVLPIILLYMYYGIYFLLKKFQFKSQVIVLFFMAFVLSNTINVKQIVQSEKVVDGPQQPLAEEMFKAVGKLTPEHAVVAFNKPWVLIHYANRNVLAVSPEWDIVTILDKMKLFNVEYLIMDVKLNKNENNALKMVWSNSRFQLLHLQKF